MTPSLPRDKTQRKRRQQRQREIFIRPPLPASVVGGLLPPLSTSIDSVCYPNLCSHGRLVNNDCS